MTLQEYTAAALVGPSFNIYQYNQELYKIVHFPRPRQFLGASESVDRSRKDNDKKLDPAISRARKTITELALCNPWDWFGTFTLDKDKYDRYDLEKFHKDFSQWIRDQRKKTGHAIRYVLVPELHKDGAWHIHGLLYDVPDLISFDYLRAELGWRVPDKLIGRDYFCWMGFDAKFGFCSLGRIHDPVGVSFYVSKYVSKSMEDSGVEVGKHLYYCSRGLYRSVLHSQLFEPSSELAAFCTQKYEFCSTGFVECPDPDKWLDALEFIDGLKYNASSCLLSDALDQEAVPELFTMQEGIQELMEGFHA